MMLAVVLALAVCMFLACYSQAHEIASTNGLLIMCGMILAYAFYIFVAVTLVLLCVFTVVLIISLFKRRRKTDQL